MIARDTALDRKLRKLRHTCCRACVVERGFEEHFEPVFDGSGHHRIIVENMDDPRTDRHDNLNCPCSPIAYLVINPPTWWERLLEFFRREDVGW
jgi:hypothetical protein